MSKCMCMIRVNHQKLSQNLHVLLVLCVMVFAVSVSVMLHRIACRSEHTATVAALHSFLITGSVSYRCMCPIKELACRGNMYRYV